MKEIFINTFQKGSNESPNVGISTMVGFDLYSKKGVAKLSKKSTIVSSNFTAAPTFMDTSAGGAYIWVQCADGSVVYSADGGVSFQPTNTAFPSTGAQHGNGMIFFQNYMFAFTDTKIYYWKDTGTASGSTPTAGAWVDWTTAKTLGALQNFAADPITGLHFPYLYPNNRGVYFGNGGAGGTTSANNSASGASCSVGLFGQVGQTTFDPTGILGTDFLWNNGILQLPSSTWIVGSLNFLPPANLAICVNQYNQPQQGSDLITWDTVSNNKFSPPLRIYGNPFGKSDSTATAGIKQLWNRNQVLYAVTGGNHSIFETNASSYNLVNDLALFSNIRSAQGAESDYPVYLNSYPSAICILGNKLLTGVATITNTAAYPPLISSDEGIYPIGVWSIAFNPDGSKSTQCEYTIPNSVVNNISVSPTSPQGSGNFGKISLVKPIPQTASSTGQLLVGFTWKEGSNSPTSGVAIVDMFNYIDDSTNTALESELFEIGTPIVPQTVSNIEINLVKNLMTNQQIWLYYRTGIDQNWSIILYQNATSSITGDGTSAQYKYTSNPIGATQFLQLRIRMNTGASTGPYTPEIKTIKIS